MLKNVFCDHFLGTQRWTLPESVNLASIYLTKACFKFDLKLWW